MHIGLFWNVSFIFLLLSSVSFASFTIEGTVRERGTRKPLENVNVYLLPAKLKATTDAKGKFVVEGVPEGKFTWIVNLSGYEKLELEDEQLPDSPVRERSLFVEKLSYDVYETTIYDRQQKRDDSTRSLKASQAAKLPGSFGDPIKAVQNLPGVNRPRAFQSNIIIQGSAPQDTRYTIDMHEVPIIFHFGGYNSVVIAEALDRVDYLSAGYGPEFGRALGGLVNVYSKAPQRDRYHGMAYVDTMNSAAVIEGPIGEKHGLLISARRSYIGEVLRPLLKGNSQFDLTVAPAFMDATAIWDSKLTERDNFRVMNVGSHDQLQFLFKEPVRANPAIRGNFNNKTAFFRTIPQLTHLHSPRTVSRYSLGFGRDWVRIDAGDIYFHLSTYTLTARSELEKELVDFWKSYWGIDNRYVWAKVDTKLPASFGGGFGSSKQIHVSQRQAQIGAYWRNVFHKPDWAWTLMPNFRTEYYSITKEVIPLPRLAARYAWSDTLGFRAASGMYAQQPQEQEVDPTFGNPDIKSPRAAHVAGGVEKDFRFDAANTSVYLGSFYKYLYKLVVRSNDTVMRDGKKVPEVYKNGGTGEAFGGETLVKVNWKPWTGWLSYTLSRSTRTEPNQPTYVFQYDQTHVLTVISQFDLGRNWSLSGRFRYSTGNPYTPNVGGVFDADNDVYVPIRGPLYSERMAPFYQLDLRVDKKWVFNHWILSAYLDIQNVTNRQNVEAIRYSYDYSQKAVVTGLPILPTFGLKGEF